jgi:hypothetical protein
MSEYRLGQEIVARSSANTWGKAKLEWVLDDVYEADEPETCLCGHSPIIELCNLRNKLNGAIATVGNCCVKKFIGLPSDLIFQAVKRIRTNNTKSLNAEAINYARQKGWFTDWEETFYFDIMRKRKLSAKQKAQKIRINEKFLSNLKRPTRGV